MPPLLQLSTSLELLQTKVKEVKDYLRSLNQLIAQRQRYYKQQEALIADMIEAGNTQLRGIDYEITEAQQVLRDLKTSTRTIRQDKKLLDEDLNAARSSFLEDEQAWVARVDSLQQQHDVLIAFIS